MILRCIGMVWSGEMPLLFLRLSFCPVGFGKAKVYVI